uniref:Cytochrome c oxidase subunit 2 n=1 Tax=Neoasterolepisma foreli TaxID=2779710 RepID=A0A7L9R530_9INSE|nr:cytochrome c oxidase subunit II [Neoasterolepisma foreli]QOL10503.1 cytochrome c oxidase subunit II [Neoasterolepisma foreli]
MATWNQMGTQDSSSPLMEQMIFFHDHALLILIMITMLVGYIMSSLFKNKFTNRFLLEGQALETTWTILPAITLIFIALPSLRLLYLLDEINQPSLTLKTIGHQWYWSYEYSDFTKTEFDSYMIPSNEMEMNSFRLLDVDNRTMLPINTDIRVLTTAADVIHSWAMPSMGIKMDAAPGRINQAGMNINRTGLFFGQCSEICGANHSFMPIVIEATTHNAFLNWIMKMTN